LAASNYLEVDSNIYRFTNITKGINGLLEIFTDIFETGAASSHGNVIPKNLFYEREHRISLLSAGIKVGPEGIATDPDEPEFFKARNIAAHAEKGELPKLYSETEADNAISDKEKKIRDLKNNLKNKKGEYKFSLTSQIEIEKQIRKLSKELRELLAQDEGSLLRDIIQGANRISRNAKLTVDEIDDYIEKYHKLEEVVRTRLVEEDKLTNDNKDN